MLPSATCRSRSGTARPSAIQASAAVSGSDTTQTQNSPSSSPALKYGTSVSSRSSLVS